MTNATARTLATARPVQMTLLAQQKAAKKEAALLLEYIQGEGRPFYESGKKAVKEKKIIGMDGKVTRRVTILPCPYTGMERAAWKRGADEALDPLYELTFSYI